MCKKFVIIYFFILHRVSISQIFFCFGTGEVVEHEDALHAQYVDTSYGASAKARSVAGSEEQQGQEEAGEKKETRLDNSRIITGTRKQDEPSTSSTEARQERENQNYTFSNTKKKKNPFESGNPWGWEALYAILTDNMIGATLVFDLFCWMFSGGALFYVDLFLEFGDYLTLWNADDIRGEDRLMSRKRITHLVEKYSKASSKRTKGQHETSSSPS